MLHQQKPPLNELTILHFGVRGMRWGIRNHVSGGEIRRARRSAARTKLAVDDIKAQVRSGQASRETLAQVKLAHLNNPDRATAARVTKGEMAVTAILLTPLTTAGLVAGSQLKSRFVQRRLTYDYYNRMDKHSRERAAKRR